MRQRCGTRQRAPRSSPDPDHGIDLAARWQTQHVRAEVVEGMWQAELDGGWIEAASQTFAPVRQPGNGRSALPGASGLDRPLAVLCAGLRAAAEELMDQVGVAVDVGHRHRASVRALVQVVVGVRVEVLRWRAGSAGSGAVVRARRAERGRSFFMLLLSSVRFERAITPRWCQEEIAFRFLRVTSYDLNAIFIADRLRSFV